MTTDTQAKSDPIESEFGRGLTYCLGLFLAHVEGLGNSISNYERLRESNPDLFSEESAVEMWFNGAADHLFELEVDSGPVELRERLALLQSRCLHWRLSMGGDPATREDAHWAIQEAKDLLRLIDEAHGVPVCKGGWE